MRMVFFDFVTQYAGKPRLTIDLLDRLRRENFADVTVLDPYGTCSEYLQMLDQHEIRCQILQPKASRNVVGGEGNRVLRLMRFILAGPELLGLQKRLRNELLSLQADLVWTSSLKGAAMTLKALGRRQIGVAYHYRRNWRSQMARGWRWKTLNDPRVTIISETHANKKKLAQQGIAAQRIYVIPNAIDVEQTRCRGGKPLDKPLPQLDKKIRLILAGSLQERKGHLCALRALATCAQNGADVVIYIPGNTEDRENAEYLQRIKLLARELHVENRVEFIGWRRDMIQVIANSTMVCLPSLDEGLPLALMEGMAMQCPVVSTPVGGIPDLIEDGVTGWLHEVDDDSGLVRAIELAHHEETRSRVIANALACIEQRFSPSVQFELAAKAFQAAAELP